MNRRMMMMKRLITENEITLQIPSEYVKEKYPYWVMFKVNEEIVTENPCEAEFIFVGCQSKFDAQWYLELKQTNAKNENGCGWWCYYKGKDSNEWIKVKESYSDIYYNNLFLFVSPLSLKPNQSNCLILLGSNYDKTYILMDNSYNIVE